MKFFLLLLYLMVGLAAFYYITVFFHIFFNIFGDKVSTGKAFIPFYGWIVGLRPEKKEEKKEEEPEAKEEKPKKKATRKPRAKKSADNGTL